MAIEIDDLASQVERAGVAGDVAELWREVFRKHTIDADYFRDLVEAHLHPTDNERWDGAKRTLEALASPVSVRR